MDNSGTTVTTAITSGVAEALVLGFVTSATSFLVSATPAAANVLLSVGSSKIAFLMALNNTITTVVNLRWRIRIGDASSNGVGVGVGIRWSIRSGNGDRVAERNSDRDGAGNSDGEGKRIGWGEGVGRSHGEGSSKGDGNGKGLGSGNSSSG